jgi:hypothetical protein
MQNVCVIVAVMVVAASPAFAQSARRSNATFAAAVVVRCVWWPDTVDLPDPNIRFEMMRQQNWRKGG